MLTRIEGWPEPVGEKTGCREWVGKGYCPGTGVGVDSRESRCPTLRRRPLLLVERRESDRFGVAEALSVAEKRSV